MVVRLSARRDADIAAQSDAKLIAGWEAAVRLWQRRVTFCEESSELTVNWKKMLDVTRNEMYPHA